MDNVFVYVLQKISEQEFREQMELWGGGDLSEKNNLSYTLAFGGMNPEDYGPIIDLETHPSEVLRELEYDCFEKAEPDDECIQIKNAALKMYDMLGGKPQSALYFGFFRDSTEQKRREWLVRVAERWNGIADLCSDFDDFYTPEQIRDGEGCVFG